MVVLVAASEAQAECKNNKNPAQAERDLLFYWRCMSPLLFSVVDVVALCRSHLFLEVGNAGFDEDVVPLDELLDVAAVHTVAIEGGQHLGEIVEELGTGGFLHVEGALLTFLQGFQALEDVHQGHIIAVGKHGDVGQRGDAVGAECGNTLVGGIECLDNEVVLTA